MTFHSTAGSGPCFGAGLRGAPARGGGRWSKLLAGAAAVLTALVLPACSSPTAPGDHVEFIVSVVDEQFVLRLTDPDSIQLAEQNRLGLNNRFPLGPLRQGNGGFNAPWSWHLDPAQTQMVEVAIELCDGRPSYVEQNRQEFATYCPWGARVIGRR